MNTLYKSPTIACLSISTFIPGINFDLVGEQNTYVDPAACRHSAVGYKISLQRHGDSGPAGAGNKSYRRDAIIFPPELIQGLRDSILTQDREAIFAVIERIEPMSSDTAKCLRILMDNFQTGLIGDLLGEKDEK